VKLLRQRKTSEQAQNTHSATDRALRRVQSHPRAAGETVSPFAGKGRACLQILVRLVSLNVGVLGLVRHWVYHEVLGKEKSTVGVRRKEILFSIGID